MPFPCVYIKEDPDLMVALLRIRVFYKNDPFYSEMKVHPFGVRRISIQGLERSKSKKEIDRVWKGLEILRRINANYGGRKMDSTKLSIDVFRNRALEVYKNYFESSGSIPSDLYIANELNISSATFYRYLKKCGWNKQQFRDDAEKFIEEN